GVEKGVLLVADLDVRLALPSFEARYPDELQQMLVIQEVDLEDQHSVDVLFHSRTLRDHYHQPYQVRSGTFLKASAYNETEEGLIAAGSLIDISAACTVKSATKDSIQLNIQHDKKGTSSKAMVMAAFTYLYPDVFAPHLVDFQDDMFA